jgi:hypothetical protein
MEANLDPSLAAACDDEKINDRDLDSWIDAVKTFNEKIARATHRQKAFAEEAVARATLKRNGKAAGLSEQGRTYVRNTNTPSMMSNTDNTCMTGPTSTGPKLLRTTPSEHVLLNDFEGCVKCRRFFAGHRARNCTNDFPSPAGYRTLTMDDVNTARCRGQKTVASIQVGSSSTNADPTQQSFASSSASVVTAVMPAIPSSVLRGDRGNLSKDSDDSVSATPPTVPFSVPFSAPHLLWNCAVQDPSTLADVPLTALMDNGSHVVLIHANLADCLKLRCHLLPVPMPIDLALYPNPNKSSAVTLTEWVKLKLSDRNGYWSPRTVRAVVAKDLCHDVILGLPFLNVNGIVIDHAENSCIDKKSGFDLLHPRPLPRSPVQKTILPHIAKRKQTVYD